MRFKCYAHKFTALLWYKPILLYKVTRSADSKNNGADKLAIFPNPKLRKFAFWYHTAVMPLLARIPRRLMRRPINPKNRLRTHGHSSDR